MSGLGLIPNEIVGYRFKPDWHSWNIVLVKRHGPQSKHAGEEYETVLAYCKNLDFAATWMMNHAARTYGAQGQEAVRAVTGSAYETQALVDAMAKAQASVHAAIMRLQRELDDAGLRNKDLVNVLGGPSDDEAAEA